MISATNPTRYAKGLNIVGVCLAFLLGGMSCIMDYRRRPVQTKEQKNIEAIRNNMNRKCHVRERIIQSHGHHESMTGDRFSAVICGLHCLLPFRSPNGIPNRQNKQSNQSNPAAGNNGCFLRISQPHSRQNQLCRVVYPPLRSSSTFSVS
eukprot:g177.t1